MKKKKTLFNFYKKRIDTISSNQIVFYYIICLLSFLIASILISYTYFSINYKYNKNVRLPFVNGSTLPQGFINLSIELDKEEIIISSDDRKVFRWSAPNWNNKDITPLIDYLKRRIDQITFEAILSMRFSEQKALTVLSVDSKLAMIHIYPVIQALAASGITHYAFAGEVINPNL